MEYQTLYYKEVMEETIEEFMESFDKKLNRAIKKGWKPLGGSCFVIGNSSRFYITQAMIRDLYKTDIYEVDLERLGMGAKRLIATALIQYYERNKSNLHS